MLAAMIVVVAGVSGVGGSALSAFHGAYLAGMILAALGTIFAWTLIRTDDARSTMNAAA